MLGGPCGGAGVQLDEQLLQHEEVGRGLAGVEGVLLLVAEQESVMLNT